MSGMVSRPPEHSAKRRSLIDALLAREDLDAPIAAPIARREGEGTAPLSFAQERLWFLEQLEPGRPVYNMLAAFRLRFAVDAGILGASLGAVARRHEALRTTFAAPGGTPVQIIHAELVPPLRVEDLTDVPDPEQPDVIQRAASEEAENPFDLTRGPLLRARLLRVGADDHILLLAMHHIVSDGWSLGLVMEELAAGYGAGVSGGPSARGELPIQYADFSVWQRASLQGPLLEELLAYWTGQLAGTPALLELPTDHPRPPVFSFRGARHAVVFPPDLLNRLRSLSQREGVTLYMTLLAAFQVQLRRYTGSDDIFVGSPVAGRNRPELEALIGLFANTVVMRTDLSGDPTFQELLQRVKRVTLGAQAHQDLPFEKLVEALRPQRHLSHGPIFQVLLALENTPRPTSFGGFEAARLEFSRNTSRSDLSVFLSESPEGLVGLWEYSTDLFESATIARMAEQFRVLLEAVVSDPDRSVSRLPLLTPAERRLLLRFEPEAARNYRPLHRLFEQQVSKTPEAAAITFEGRHWTYRELDARANCVARELRARGAGPEVVVGICLDRSLEMLAAILGVLKSGAAYLPLEPTHPSERLAFMLRDSGAALVISTAEAARSLPPSSRVLRLDRMVCEPCPTGPEDLSPEPGADGLAYVIYTSGSTGQPKGVEVTHRGVAHLVEALDRAVSFEDDEVWTFFHSYAFDLSVWEIWGCLLRGGRLVVVPSSETHSGAALDQLVSREQVTVLNLTPSALRQLSVERQRRGETSPWRLRKTISGGEALPRELAATLLSWPTPVWNFYGPTEASVWTTVHRLEPGDLAYPFVPVGRAIGNNRVYVLDDHVEFQGIGLMGELSIGGEGVARGYRGQAALTAQRFQPDPFGNGSRMYRTGDLARFLPDGALEFIGRRDHQVKLRGFRVELGEIEARLSEHPDVQNAVAIVREDVPGDQRLVAYVVAAAGRAPSAAPLRSFLQRQVPTYMIPSEFVFLDSFPLNRSGKIDRAALPLPAASRGSGDSSRRVAPRNPTEDTLAAIWSDVLGRGPIGVDEDFFALGGHSLLAMQVTFRIHESLGVDLPVRVLFEAPTVAGLAERIAAGASARPPLRRFPRTGKLPVSFAQRRLWFLQQLEPDSPAYSVSRAIRFRGALDVGALERALNEISRRHESLRTRFAEVEGEPVQVIDGFSPRPLEIIDRTGWDVPDREAEGARLAAVEAQTPFDLSLGPLWRYRLIRLTAEDHVLLLSVHHIASDAWSWGVIYRELAAHYGAFRSGRGNALPDLPIQYADYALWEQEWLTREVLEKQLTFCRQTLRNAPTVLNFPFARPRPRQASHRGAHERMALSPALAAALRGISAKEGATPFMTLLAGFEALLSRSTGLQDFLVGTDVTRRERMETEGLVGFFVNLVPLRADVSGDPTFRELLSRVRKSAREAFEHQDVPFERLVEALKPGRDLSRNPLVQVLFVLQNGPPLSPSLPGLEAQPFEGDAETSRFDLVLFMRDSEESLSGYWLYNPDLFEAAAIRGLSRDFQSLLEQLADDPDRRLSGARSGSPPQEDKRTMPTDELPRAKKLPAARRKKVDVSSTGSVKTGALSPGATMPLVFEPDTEEIDLVAWAPANRALIDRKLLEHGALLFRGFDVNTVARFEKFAEALCPELFGEYGDLPREGVAGKVYSSTPYPADETILYHNESSHLDRWPMKIWFYCVQPSQSGGETPIVDCRKVYERVDPAIRDEFARKGLRYVRNYTAGLDVSWQDFFGTSDQGAIEEQCRRAGIEWEWTAEGLRTSQVSPAVVQHPQTGEAVFFNQIFLHHAACLGAPVRESLVSMLGETNLPRNVFYADGSLIPDEVVAELRRVYDEVAVAFPWREGDIIMVNNMLAAHARLPFAGPRKIVVAMGEMVNKSEVQDLRTSEAASPR